MVQQPISTQISADRREIVLAKLAEDYCLFRTYPAGLNHVDLYLRRNDDAGCRPLPRVASAK